jgi:hypothetical protein
MNSSSNPEIEIKLRRIQRISSICRTICAALTVLFGVLTLLVIGAAFVSTDGKIDYFGQSIALADLTPRGRVILAVVALASGAVVIKALYHLRRLLGNYSRREIFTADSARQLRNFGASCMLWGIMKLAWAFLPLMVLAQRQQPVRVTGDAFTIGFIIVLLSWFAEMAATLREENDLTI